MKWKYPKQPNAKASVGLVRLACCDCGLVHTLGFTVDDKGILRLDFNREARSTAQLRRGSFPNLKKPLGGEKWKMLRVNT